MSDADIWRKYFEHKLNKNLIDRDFLVDFVFLLCGLRMDQNSPLVGNPKYPEMPQAFAYSFAVAKTLPVDIFLGAHGYWFNLADKIEKLHNNSEINPFINPEEYFRIVEGWEKAYLERLRRER